MVCSGHFEKEIKQEKIQEFVPPRVYMAFACWAGSNYGVGYNDIIGGLKIIIIGIVISSTFIEDFGYYIINKEKIPSIWNHVWISNYIKRTPRPIMIFLSMIGQIVAIDVTMS